MLNLFLNHKRRLLNNKFEIQYFTHAPPSMQSREDNAKGWFEHTIATESSHGRLGYHHEPKKCQGRTRHQLKEETNQGKELENKEKPSVVPGRLCRGIAQARSVYLNLYVPCVIRKTRAPFEFRRLLPSNVLRLFVVRHFIVHHDHHCDPPVTINRKNITTRRCFANRRRYAPRIRWQKYAFPVVC